MKTSWTEGKQRQNPLRGCNRHKCERPPETAKEQKQVGQLEPQP